LAGSACVRIVGGELSGRRFGPKIGPATRPTAERVRAAIASAIESRGGFRGCRVLDLFAGTGAMAFEAISRGAVGAVLVESDVRAAREIARSGRELGIDDRCTVITADLRTHAALERIAGSVLVPFDRVFVDPPYAEAHRIERLLRSLAEWALVGPHALVAVEHGKRHAPPIPEGYVVLSRPRYGDSAVLLLTFCGTNEARR
jgi:16S rRNA (guanine966-N2)-methyltransferase